MTNNSINKYTPSHNEYQNFLNNSGSLPEFKNKKYYLNQFSFLKNIADLLPSAVYILDFATQNYLYISESCKNIVGYNSEDYLKGGRDFFLSQVHPDDLQISSSKVFEKFIDYSKSLNIDEIKKCRFSINFRLKRKDGVYIKLLQQYVILEVNKHGYPILTLGVISDISSFKLDNKMIFSISHYDNNKGFHTISSNNYSTEKTNLTSREKEIVKHIVYGHSTSEIADLLTISQHTVKTHRKNIFKKTNCRNIAEIVNYSIENGLI